MNKLDNITKESWILNNCPEWGTWLNEEIENEIVEENRIAMWWLGCVGLWLKTQANTNICIDFWCGTGKRTKKNPLVNPSHQMARMSGTRIPQPNLRNIPFVLDPFAITKIDAVLATHFHSDHIDINVAAAIVKNCGKNVVFIGPQACVDLWIEWGVPLERCIVMKPGDSIKIKDMEIFALESSDRTALITNLPVPHDEPNQIPEMDLRSVNYLIKTPGGNIYHSGDSHYSNLFARHGKKHKVDIALGPFGENPIGIVDKMTSIDILRMGEALKCQVVIPVHHDVWTNMLADPNEIISLYEMRKYRLQYKFKPFIWQPGGKFIFPDDKDKIVYQHPRGFPDIFEYETDIPYPSFL